MKNLDSRLTELEEHCPTETTWIFVIHRGQELTEEQCEAAIEDYKAKNPDWEKKNINVIDMIDRG